MRRKENDKDRATRKRRLLSTQVCGIYKITTLDGFVYIGASRHIKERTRKHLHRGLVETMFVFPVDIDRDILDEFENIAFNACNEAGCKMLNIRGIGWRGKNTPEMIEKMRLKKLGKPSKNKGKKMSKEHCDMLREAFKNRKRGHKHAPETIEKMKQAWIKRKKLNL